MRFCASSHGDRCTFWASCRSRLSSGCNFKRANMGCNVLKPLKQFYNFPLFFYLFFLQELKYESWNYPGFNQHLGSVVCVSRPGGCPVSQNLFLLCWSNGGRHPLWAYRPQLFPTICKPSGRCTFNRINGNYGGRHCFASAAQLLKHKNQYSSSRVFFYKELSNAYCSWHCHRKWRIILCTRWKKQAQENPNRFNSI